MTDEASPVGSVLELVASRVVWRRRGRRMGAIALRDLVTRIQAAGHAPQSWQLHPHQVRLMVQRRGGEVVGVVIEMPPGPRQVSLITEDSEQPVGPGARYEKRHLSFPWVVLVIVFVRGELSGLQQAFYRTTPIVSLNDELCFTNLLNVAKGYEQDSWVCLVNAPKPLAPLGWEQRVNVIGEHFWHAAFNRSSEVHEGNSYWGRMRKLDHRLASVSTWEAATRANPYFALEVSWRRTGSTVAETLECMLDKVAPWRPIECVEHLVTLMQQQDQ